MASITIRNLNPQVKARLRIRAATNGRSMEEEARRILGDAVTQGASPPKGLGTALHELFRHLGGLEPDIPRRDPMRPPPSFDYGDR